MAKYSRRSQIRLETCTENTQKVFNKVIETYDCTIIEGYRTPEDQLHYFNTGKSKVKRGEHNERPSRAVDVAPYPIVWPEKPKVDAHDYDILLSNYVKAVARFYHFAGFVLATALSMGIKLRWGGDWDQDLNFFDQTFDDLVHFEEL